MTCCRTSNPTALSLTAPWAKAVPLLTVALPSLKTIILTTLLPTCLGYYKYEYGVSYAYGLGTSSIAFLTLLSLLSFTGPNASLTFVTIAKFHAAAVVFYGTRLNLFLLYRELCIDRFRRMREAIEDRQRNKEENTGIIGIFVNRTPFILSCACLYAGLASVPLMSAKLIDMGFAASSTAGTRNVGLTIYKYLVGMTWFGFGLGALADLTKLRVKAKEGPDHLVTGGVYRLLRHPNYTGEMIGWSSSFVASLVAIACCCSSSAFFQIMKGLAVPLILSACSTVGILFVLLAASTNLEKRQYEKYGGGERYKKWISHSWSGPTLSPKSNNEEY